MSAITISSATSNGNPTGTPATALGTTLTSARVNVLNAGASKIWIHQDSTGAVPSCATVVAQGVPVFAPNAAGIEVPFVLEDPVNQVYLGAWFIATDPSDAVASASVRVE